MQQSREKGIFARVMEGLASAAAVPKTVMIDVEAGQRHRFERFAEGISKCTARPPACSRKGGPGDQRGRLIGRTGGGMNTKLHAVTDAEGCPIRFFTTAGQVSDYMGVAALLGSLPQTEWLLATAAIAPTVSEMR